MKRKLKTKKEPEKLRSEDLIHIRLEYEEALQAKRDVISSKIELLKIAKVIKRYYDFRLNELETKIKLYKLMRLLKTTMGKLQTTLPKIKMPNILKKDVERDGIKEIKRRVRETSESESSGDLETQLADIQRKLSAIHG